MIPKLIFVIFVLYGFNSCSTTEPPPGNNGNASLYLEDVSCTEAWIKISITNITLPVSAKLLKDDSLVQNINLTRADTILYVDSLLPNQTYNFYTTIESSNQSPITTNQLQVTTLDTTSNDYTWQTWTFGSWFDQSYLFDVSIINDTLAYAVGGIYLLDSLGQPDPNAYNLVRWNGSDWKLNRINMKNSCNPVTYPPLQTIWTFSAKNTFFTSKGSIGWYDGKYVILDCGVNQLLNGAITKCWGINNTDLYVIGLNGSIDHYQNAQGSKIESGTNDNLTDISGDADGDLYTCGVRDSDGTSIILKKSASSDWQPFVHSGMVTKDELFHPNLYGEIVTIYVEDKNTIYAAGNILYRCKFRKWNYVRSLPENYIGGNPNVYYRGFIDRVKGTAPNDLWIIGDRNTVRHFNGIRWKQIGMPYDPNIDLVWRGISIKGKEAVLVGTYNRQAIIMIAEK